MKRRTVLSSRPFNLTLYLFIPHPPDKPDPPHQPLSFLPYGPTETLYQPTLATSTFYSAPTTFASATALPFPPPSRVPMSAPPIPTLAPLQNCADLPAEPPPAATPFSFHLLLPFSVRSHQHSSAPLSHQPPPVPARKPNPTACTQILYGPYQPNLTAAACPYAQTHTLRPVTKPPPVHTKVPRQPCPLSAAEREAKTAHPPHLFIQPRSHMTPTLTPLTTVSTPTALNASQ